MGEPSYPLTNQLWLPPGLTTSPPRVLPMARGLLTPRPTMVESDMPATVDSAILVMEDTMARGLLTPRPTMVESDTLVMVDSAILVMEDTMARGLLILRPTTVDSAMPDMVVMAMVLDTDTLDKYCGELQTLKL